MANGNPLDSASRRRVLTLACASASVLPGCQFLVTRFVEPAPAAPPAPAAARAAPVAAAAAPRVAPERVQPPAARVPAAAEHRPLLAADGTQATYVFNSGAHMWVFRRGPLTLHHYVTPEPGGRATAAIIEFVDRLWVIDTLGVPAYGQELRYYANTLEKQIARVIFTHEHPDTWSGWAAFSQFPTFAPRETEGFLRRVMPTMAPRAGVVAPKLTGLVTVGDERIGGVRVHTRIARDVESAAIVTLGFPDQRVWVASDMVYHGRHAYLGNRHWAHWREQLSALPAWINSEALVLPGHGAPAGLRSIAQMQRYLSVAQQAFARTSDASDIARTLKEQFPDYTGDVLLNAGIAHALMRRG